MRFVPFGVLTLNTVWLSTEADFTRSIAWGDYDSDGDLDLAVGNDAEPNRLYRNDEGTLTASAIWSSAETDSTYSIAWGDYDLDGDLDLAVGNDAEPNRLYRNDEGTLTASAIWSSTETDNTSSIAWGDYDSDGDLDLAVGNMFEPSRIYLNESGTLTASAVWSSVEEDETYSVAWGDYDSDGDLDLVVGNRAQPNHLYRNDHGVLAATATWSSVEAELTYSVAWGDYDGDGDLDLAVGNHFGPDKLYRNDGGQLTARAVWSSNENHSTFGLAWGDYDGDGDLDLATENGVYQNQQRKGSALTDNPPYVTISRPGSTDEAAFFSTPQIITQSDRISIAYTLFDPEGDPVSHIFPEYSPNGGGQWFPATAASETITTNLTTSASGTPHTFVWNAKADLIKNDNVAFRIRPQAQISHSPIMWSALGSQSAPFRVEAPWFIRVVDENGDPISGATVYADGQPITQTLTGLTVTDQAGLINPGLIEVGTPLTVLSQKAEQPTARAAHDGWAYRVYLTNLNLDQNGEPQPFLSTEIGEQRLVMRQDNPLILFNIVVSVEWDADEAYLATIEEAFRKASDYLYDVTDGQMAFAEVKIYDNAEYWSHADFQISTKNTVRPYAFIGGITSDNTAHSIRVGRFWSGNSGNSGDWDQPNGYRTLIHEFGHYALYLYDEYFVRTVDENGNFTGQQPAACTGVEVIGDDETPTNASIMYYQYKASELADRDRWEINCRNTEQARVNNEPDWQTVLRKYSDQEGQPDWLLNTPSSRGSVMAGPETFPTHLLPFPVVKVQDSGTGEPPRQLTVLDPVGEPFSSALVALYPYSDTIAIDQGLTDLEGQLTIYGAVEGDTIRVASFDGALAVTDTVDSRLTYELILQPNGRRMSREGNISAYLELVPGSEGDTVSLAVHGASAGSVPLTAIVIPGDGGGSHQSTSLAYSATEGAYTGQISFAGVGLGSGEVQVSGIADSQSIFINSHYNLFQVVDSQDNDLVSEDGNFELHLAPGSSISANAYAMIFPTGYLPKPLPNGKQLLGSAYGIRFSGAAIELTKPGLLSMHYHPEVMGNPTDLAIYRWNPTTENWLLVGGQTDQQHNSITAPVTQLGIYALGGNASGISKLYLPLILAP